jgi:hypothetical protein
MHRRPRHASAGILLAAALAGSTHGAEGAEPTQLARGGSLEIAGRQVHCENVRTRLDRRLPNLGMAAPYDRLMVLNPAMLRRFSDAVQLFVFHHECGHMRVGRDEIEADCWAVERGIRDGWLDRNGLAQVCRSFRDAPETPTHPSGKRRCAALDRCFGAVEVRLERQPAGAGQQPVSVARDAGRPPAARPALVEAPRLLWTNGDR